MSEQEKTITNENPEIQQSLGIIQHTLDDFMATATVERVYGKPVRHGDTLIIPTAEVLCGMGFGVGFGMGGAEAVEPDDESASEENAVKNPSGAGGGGAGGGRTFARPVALVVATPDGVRVEPVFDRTKVAMTALTAAAFIVGGLLRLRRFPLDEE